MGRLYRDDLSAEALQPQQQSQGGVAVASPVPDMAPPLQAKLLTVRNRPEPEILFLNFFSVYMCAAVRWVQDFQDGFGS